MATPLYQSLKSAGFTTYVFPSASEDISASYQNDNYKFTFSKFTLLNLDVNKMDFSVFNTESLNPISNKSDELVNSLRNYVANQEETIRTSRLSANQYFYNPNVLQTTSEKIFWKWLRKTGLIQFETALPNDEYIDTTDFSVDETKPTDYFKEYVWRERQSKVYNILNINDNNTFALNPLNNNLSDKVYKITLSTDTNIKPNDIITITSTGIINIGFVGSKDYIVTDVQDDFDPQNNKNTKNYIVYIVSHDILVWNNIAVATLSLKYTKVVQYIGEISSRNNITQSDSSWTEILAYLPDQNGATTDILFRVKADENYGAGNQYPVLSSQDQPEIVGAELNTSPIVSFPDMYPGDQYAQFDVDQKYICSNGFQDRKRGDYFGIPTETNRRADRVISSPYLYPEFDGSNLDGVTMDFDPSHYVRMNIPSKKSKNFDIFNSQSFNNVSPSDFDFNAILWYYEVEDKLLSPTTTTITETGSTSTTNDISTVTDTITKTQITNNSPKNKAMNLYAITFLNPVTTYVENLETKYIIEPYKKIVTNTNQDGISYSFTLNLNFDISNTQVQTTYDPKKIYDLYDFSLFNEAMTKMTYATTLMQNLANNVNIFQTQLNNINQLLYTQTNITTINNRIDSLNNLILLYSKNQIGSSDTIAVSLDESVNPPVIKLNATDARFTNIITLNTKSLYDNTNLTAINYKVTVPKNKDFNVNIINNDDVELTLDKPLNIIFDRDLDYKQTVVINIFGNNAKYNKKLNINIVTSYTKTINTTIGTALFSTPLDLPIDSNLNVNSSDLGISKRWNNNIESILPYSTTGSGVFLKKVSDTYFITCSIKPYLANSFKNGDVITLNNFKLLFNNLYLDISGQYQITGDILNNKIIVQIPYLGPNLDSLYTVLNTSSVTEYEITENYFTQPFFISVNYGYTIEITNYNSNGTTLSDVYNIKTIRKI
jgi:hypothetical protein